MWVCVYLFSVATPDSPDWFHWTGLGKINLRQTANTERVKHET